MTEKYESLAAALAAFQADLPSVNKGSTGQVGQNRNYKYADLGDLNAAVLPRLAAVGLSFSTKPTLNESGKFVLAYVLRHVSGESDGGEWPLPDSGNSQAMGSAVTYARRYSLQAVTGVAPDEDDDGRAAGEYQHRAAQRRPQNGAQQRRQPAAAEQATDDAPSSPGAVQGALRFVRQRADREGIPWNDVRLQYAQQYQGEVIDDATDPNRLTAFAKLLAANGAPA